MSKKALFLLFLLIGAIAFALSRPGQANGATTYYVSSSLGSDSNDGLSEGSPFASIGHVNSLNLQPGDQVLFRCGDMWRTESLVATESGTAGNPILFDSYPAGCTDQPVLSGAQPIGGWSVFSGNVYVADLSAGGNSGLFPAGVNQLFEGNNRLTHGRWPNLNAPDGGYSTIDGHSGNVLTDNQLPSNNWAGAHVHIKGMRWYMLNRIVTSSSGNNLTLNVFPGCFADDCEEWGYFISNHLATLDQNGEWYYDTATNRVYLYSTSGTPSNIEGSVVIEDADEGFSGGIQLGHNQVGPLRYVTVNNLEVSRWFDNGVTTPRNLSDENSNLTITNMTIRDIDNAAIFLATWVWDQGADNGWRGGTSQQVNQNLIERANHMAIYSYSTNSTFRDNIIRDIALLPNLGRDGTGCPLNTGGGICTRDAIALYFPVENPDYTGFGNVIRYNQIERIGSSGMQISGADNLIDSNYIRKVGLIKGDNGGIVIFGGAGFTASQADDITIQNNIIISATGNTDGTAPFFRPLFSVGIYVDQYADNVTVADNTVIGSTIDGILFQNSRGSITDNTLYNNNFGTMSRGQIGLYNDPTEISNMSGNVLYGLNMIDGFTFAKTLHTENADQSHILAGDNNYYFNPYRPDNISLAFDLHTLAEWQAVSGLDGNSRESWFSLGFGDAPRSRIFYNASKSPLEIDLGNRLYLDLDQNGVTGSITLAPFTSWVLIDSGAVALSPPLMVFQDASSSPQTATLTNVTGSPLTINDISVSANFSQVNDCPAVLSSDQSCSIEVSFTPGGAEPVEGALTVSHNMGDDYTTTLLGGLLEMYLPIIAR